MTSPVPNQYRYAAVPHLFVDGASEAIDLYADAFGATELFRLPASDGSIMHAEVAIGSVVLMLSDAHSGFSSPATLGGASVAMHVFVDDVDALHARAIAAGVETLQPPTDMFHGDRTTILRDRFGHAWVFLTRIAQVPPEEVLQRAASSA